MKRITSFVVCLLFFGISVMAQDIQITGKVTSSEDGSALPGVSVVVKGTTTGTQTDINGEYSLTASSNAVLVFSFIGMADQQIQLSGQTVLDVVLAPDVVQVDEVVVTAMGIRREKRELGYAVTSLTGDEAVKARDANVLNTLSGKVPGMRVTQQSGTLGGGTKILIRGIASLSGENDPIFVVDGVPISNNSYNGTRNDIISGGVDVGNKGGDINSDDIESITVLKGAAATALYGSDASNGAIIITTKRGNRGDNLGVTVNSSFRFDNVLKLPDFQNEYGPGNDGIYDINSMNGWGPKISEVQNQRFPIYTGDSITLQAYPDNVKDFYQTGITAVNNVAISGGTEDSDFRLSYTNLHQTGVIPSTALDRNTVSINAGKTFQDKLTARVSMTYARTDGDGKPAQGSNNNNVLTNVVNYIPRTMDMNFIEDNIYDENNVYLAINDGKANNPYFLMQNNKFTNYVERLFGNASLTFQPFPWLELTERAGLDMYKDFRRQITSKGTFGVLQGAFDDTDIYERRLSNDIMFSLSKENILNDFTVKLIGGHNLQQTDWDRISLAASELVAEGVYNYSNAKTVTSTNASNIERKMGLYYDLTIGYKDFLYLNTTGRNDWTSTLPKSNNSYFYPSVNASFIFSELLPANNILSLGKVRANWANVGVATAPYRLDFLYYPDAGYFIQYLDENTFPHGGAVAFYGPRTLPGGQTLVPENQNSFEVGMDLIGFNSRLSLTVDYYNQLTSEQIISVEIPASSGYEAKTLNAGAVRNEGVEVTLSGVPVSIGSFRWTAILNFTRNVNTVEELFGDLEEMVLTSGWSGLQIKAKPGKSIGMYGTGWKRDPNGNVIIDDSGLREVEDDMLMGKTDPDWFLGIQNEFSYKNLNLSFLVDIRQGGVMFSNTAVDLRNAGLAEETLEHRGEFIIDQGVQEIDNGDGTFSYVPNDVAISQQDYWQNYALTSNTEAGIFDASYIKLREVTLAYSLPKKWLNNLFIANVAVGVEGRNLWIIKDHVPHVDPEVNFFGASLMGEGVEFSSVPSTRSFGFNIKIDF